MRFFFILGNNPALSLAEIVAVLGINEEYLVLSNDFLIIDLDKKINVEKLMKILGGTVKIGIIEKLKMKNEKLKVGFRLGELIKNLIFNKNKKFYFGFSVYGELSDKKVKKQLNGWLKKLGMEIKKELKLKGMGSRWVVSREKQLSSVVVKKNKLVSENGVEWCFLKSGSEVFLGKTLAAQEFEEYGKRDYNRPARDARSGMLPPKLARIMINLTLGSCRKIPQSSFDDLTLLDPFCGGGTILQEAAILGIKNIIGSDLSEKAVSDAKRNVKWLQEKIILKNTPSPFLHSVQDKLLKRREDGVAPLLSEEELGAVGRVIKFKFSIFQSDVKQLSDKIQNHSIDLIATEPYLGPPLRGYESEQKINDIINKLSELYLAAFREFKKVLKRGSGICVVCPVFNRITSQPHLSGGYNASLAKLLPIIDKIKNLDFKFINLIPDQYKKNLAKNLSERGTIVYGRAGQRVWREILVFCNL